MSLEPRKPWPEAAPPPAFLCVWCTSRTERSSCLGTERKYANNRPAVALVVLAPLYARSFRKKKLRRNSSGRLSISLILNQNGFCEEHKRPHIVTGSYALSFPRSVNRFHPENDLHRRLPPLE